MKMWIATGLVLLAAAAQAQTTEIPTPDNRGAVDLVVHPYDAGRWVAGASQQVYLTTDGGLSWKLAAGLPAGALTERIFAHPGQPYVVFVKTATVGGPRGTQPGGLYRSADFGQTWTAVAEDASPLTANFQVRVVTPAAADPADAAHLFGTRRAPWVCTFICSSTDRELSLHESHDGGVTWSAPLLDGGPSGLRHVSYPPPVAPGRLFVVDASYGAYQSIDNGQTWHPFATAFTHAPFWVEQDPHDRFVLYAAGTLTDGTRNVVARSDDAGQSWRTILQFPVLSPESGARLTLDPFRPGRAWLATESGLLRSDDRGTTWMPAGYDAGALLVSKVVPSPADDTQALVIFQGRLHRATGTLMPRLAVEFRFGDRYWVSGDRGETMSQDYRAYEAVRTGERFGLWSQAERPAGAMPMCRFQGNPAYGQSSRFITLAGFECDIVKANPAFVLEGEGEYFALPASAQGTCPAGTVAVRRFNNQQASVNHRYVVTGTEAARMRAAGWYDEGVCMCARPLGADE